MKYCFLFVLSVLFVPMNYGQTQSAQKSNYDLQSLKRISDSLIKADNLKDAIALNQHNLNIRLDAEKTEEANIIFNTIGLLHYRKKDYKKATYDYKEAIKIDSTSENSAKVYYNLFLVKRKVNQPDSVLYFLEKSLSIYKNNQDSYDANNTFLTAGIIYKNRQQFDKALHYLVIAYKGFTDLKSDRKLANVCITIGNIHNSLKNYNQALEYHLEALTLQKKIDNKNGIARCYNNLANVYDNLEILDSAVANYNKALGSLKPNTKQYSTALNNLANTYLKQNNIKLARENYIEAIKINTFLKDSISLAYNYNGILSLELKNDNLKPSKLYLDKIADLLDKNSDNIILLNYYESQVEYNQKKQDYKTALNYQLKYSELYKQIYNKEQTELVQNIQSKFEYEKKENEILKLNLLNKNKELELVKKNKAINNKNNVLLILSFIIFLAIIAFYAYIQQQKLKSQNTKHEKLKAIYEGQEIIKKRIARDLHDIITTNFDGLRLKILALKKSTEPTVLIDETTNELKNINRQIRVVSHRLSPLEMQMSHQKFTAVITSRLSEFHLYGKVFVELEDQLPDVLNTLDLSVQNNFYGILLEILNNVEKHAHATKVHINHFIDTENIIHFIFTDNGIGIDKDFKEGIGLLNIRQRCEIINGECNIKKVEVGTQFSVQFPSYKKR
ncbi:tetratricopeptide repeat protein [Winogradskyella sp. PG-2]|uniref:ATP-binding protein n=1 Tax=Winogradskyella sp. PG-2 TaxID=754409 RepID=UPI0004585F22|nr:tetratricopeptide repeat protein [Winogradskyella sp. PG-2]BAO76874.1 hypothetical protein WPG_2644 [Winogradskyella sp. PG-2]